MSTEVPDVAVHVEKRGNGVMGKVVGVAACALVGAGIGAGINEYRLDKVGAEHVATQEQYQRCAEYVGRVTQDPAQSPIIDNPATAFTASEFSDCKVPGEPADYYSHPLAPRGTIATVKLSSQDILRDAAQNEERSAAATERSLEGMKQSSGIGALAGALIGGAAVAWLVRRKPTRSIE